MYKFIDIYCGGVGFCARNNFGDLIINNEFIGLFKDKKISKGLLYENESITKTIFGINTFNKKIIDCMIGYSDSIYLIVDE